MGRGKTTTRCVEWEEPVKAELKDEMEKLNII